MLNNELKSRSINELNWSYLDFSNLSQEIKINQKNTYRFFKINEISEDKSAAYRLSMANVIATLRGLNCSLVYLFSGDEQGVSLYLGVSSCNEDADIFEFGEMIKTSFEGNFLGAQINPLKNENNEIEQLLNQPNHLGLITGIPSFNENDQTIAEHNLQGIERIANSLVNEKWQLTVVVEAISVDSILANLDDIYSLSSELSSQIKYSIQASENKGQQQSVTDGSSESTTNGTSKSISEGSDKSKSTSGNETTNSSAKSIAKGGGTNEGTNKSETEGSSDSTTDGKNKSESDSSSTGESVSVTKERIDKRKEDQQKHLCEVQVSRYRKGLSKGLFKTAVYVSAENKATFERLSSAVLSIYQGNESTMTPLQLNKLAAGKRACLKDYITIRSFSTDQHSSLACTQEHALLHSIPKVKNTLWGATLLTSEELSIVTSLPSKELPGFKIRKSVDFGLNTPVDTACNQVKLGNIIQNGRFLENKQVSLPVEHLSKHIFITGVTGSGKTTTCMKLLLESKLPFLVIEPAKTEYRALQQQTKDVEYYCIGNEKLTPFRLNPFQLSNPSSSLMGHISVLKATLTATFPMEAAMPSIVEEAIIQAYNSRGWDIYSNDNYLFDDPFAANSQAWPTFTDMIAALDEIIKSKGMGKEFEEKYQGSLVARLTNLTLGIKGRMLNTRYSIDFDALLDKKVVIELEELKDEQDKSLFMGLIISRLAECMKIRHKKDKKFQHVTLIEEAHRLLSKVEQGDTESKKMGVTMFTDLLSEVRKYGEGLIIADQSPTKLVADIVKNTNIKIVHRLLDAADRNVIGDAMSLDDDQKGFLQHLQPGETIIYSGGWHAPVRVQVNQLADTQGEAIQEKDIAKQGAKQLWQQQAHLLPNTAEHQALFHHDEANFGRWITSGMYLLNIFLRVNNALGADYKKFKNMLLINKMQQNYQKKYNEVTDELAISSSQLDVLLVALFMDNAVIQWDDDSYSLANECMGPAFSALADSATAFNQCKQSQDRGLTSCMTNKVLAAMNSI
ncbi:MAG: hypothetical protein COA47_13685 [Robiginitomaculum sp.]|nr:MAG: hypothetical protein COA47_13685 [Robiginitomaculum sp.]